STISRTDAAAKPRCAKARAASSSRRGRRLELRRAGPAEALRSRTARELIARLERQTLVWSSAAARPGSGLCRSALRRVADAGGDVPRRNVHRCVLDVAGLVVEEEIGLELAQEL